MKKSNHPEHHHGPEHHHPSILRSMLNRLPGLNSLGFSIIEILMGAALLGIMMMGFASMMTVQNRAIVGNRTIISRDGLRLLLERYAMKGAYLAKSAAYRDSSSSPNDKGNLALDYCLNGQPTGPTTECPSGVFPNCCKQTTAASPQPFIFLDPSDLNGTAVLAGTELASNPLAVTTFRPARFTVSGESCQTASPQCPIEIVTAFIASCEGGDATCQKASQISVTYSIRQAAGVKLQGGPPLQTFTKTVTPTLAQAAASTTDAGGGCLPPNPTTCPVGMSLVKGDTTQNSFCIDTAANGATYLLINNTTYTQSYDAMRVCEHRCLQVCTKLQFKKACDNYASATPAVTGMPPAGSYEWTSTGYNTNSTVIAGFGVCAATSAAGTTMAYPFRCCSR